MEELIYDGVIDCPTDVITVLIGSEKYSFDDYGKVLEQNNYLSGKKSLAEPKSKMVKADDIRSSG